MIQLSVSNEVLCEIVDEESAASASQKLESLYMTKSLVSRLHLKQRLFMLRMNEGMSIKHHMNKFTSIIMDLDNADVKIDDEDQVLLLLCSLPPSFKNFRKTLIYRKRLYYFRRCKEIFTLKRIDG